MRRHALAILAAISLFGIGVFGCGYVARFEAYFLPKTGPHYVRVGAYEGCLVVAREPTASYMRDNSVPIDGVEIDTVFSWGLPNAWYALSHFEAHATPDPGFIISIPLWCLILPCTIAPTLWLRRHRRRTPRGFAVEPAAEATIELPMK